MLKRVALPMAALAALTSAGAKAADLGVAPLRGSEVVAAAPAYGYDWSGVYIGGSVGVQTVHNSGHHSDATNGTRDDGAGNMVYNFDYGYSGARFTYGLHAGLLGQFGAVVLGVEADIDGPTGSVRSPWYNGNAAFAGGFGGNSYQQRVTSNWQGSLRARLGFAHHATLFYLTGGLAFGNFKVCTVLDDCNGFVGHVVKYNTTRVGWTIGGGIEHKFTANWSGRLEYRYSSFGSRSCHAEAPCSINANASDIDNKIETHAVRLGLSYTFAPPPAPLAPIVARY